MGDRWYLNASYNISQLINQVVRQLFGRGRSIMSSSTTSSAGDRKKPRQLTREELWSSYCEKITKQEYLDALDNYTRPTEYPLKRRTYYLFPPAVAVEKQAVRLFKLSLRDNAAQGTTSVVEEAFEMLKLSSTSEGILEKCLAHNDLKRAGNVCVSAAKRLSQG